MLQLILGTGGVGGGVGGGRGDKMWEILEECPSDSLHPKGQLAQFQFAPSPAV
jgi:hypothetical protein